MITSNKLNTNQAFINITVRCMLNPKNRDMYLGYLTLEKIESLITKTFDNDPEFVTAFWTAFSIAHAKYLEQELENECITISNNAYTLQHTCPNCACQTFTSGVACPNCEYVEE